METGAFPGRFPADKGLSPVDEPRLQAMCEGDSDTENRY